MTRRKKTLPAEPDKALLTEMNRAIDLVTPRSVPAVATEVIGPVPSWLPDDLTNEGARVLDKLLNRNSPATVRGWLVARELEMRPVAGYRSLPTYPLKFKNELDSLAYIRQIISLGKTRGLEQHARYLQRKALLQRNSMPERGRKSGRDRHDKTQERNEQIRMRCEAGEKQAAIAEDYGLSAAQVSRICKERPTPGAPQLPASPKDDQPA